MIKTGPVKNTKELIELMIHNHQEFKKLQASYYGKKAVADFYRAKKK